MVDLLVQISCVAGIIAAFMRLIVNGLKVYKSVSLANRGVACKKADEIWNIEISWLRDEEKKSFIAQYAKTKTKSIWSNAAYNDVLLLFLLGVVFVSEICRCVQPGIGALWLFIEVIFAFLTVPVALMLALDVPCVQGIYFKPYAALHRFRNRRDVNSITLFQMRSMAENCPYQIVDARDLRNGDIRVLESAIRADDVSRLSLDKKTIYFCCSDYGVHSINVAKRLTEAGFKAYSVKNACSNCKGITRITLELCWLRQEGLLRWQGNVENKARD